MASTAAAVYEPMLYRRATRETVRDTRHQLFIMLTRGYRVKAPIIRFLAPRSYCVLYARNNLNKIYPAHRYRSHDQLSGLIPYAVLMVPFIQGVDLAKKIGGEIDYPATLARLVVARLLVEKQAVPPDTVFTWVPITEDYSDGTLSDTVLRRAVEGDINPPVVVVADTGEVVAVVDKKTVGYVEDIIGEKYPNRIPGTELYQVPLGRKDSIVSDNKIHAVKLDAPKHKKYFPDDPVLTRIRLNQVKLRDVLKAISFLREDDWLTATLNPYGLSYSLVNDNIFSLNPFYTAMVLRIRNKYSSVLTEDEKKYLEGLAKLSFLSSTNPVSQAMVIRAIARDRCGKPRVETIPPDSPYYGWEMKGVEEIYALIGGGKTVFFSKHAGVQAGALHYSPDDDARILAYWLSCPPHAYIYLVHPGQNTLDRLVPAADKLVQSTVAAGTDGVIKYVMSRILESRYGPPVAEYRGLGVSRDITVYRYKGSDFYHIVYPQYRVCDGPILSASIKKSVEKRVRGNKYGDNITWDNPPEILLVLYTDGEPPSVLSRMKTLRVGLETLGLHMFYCVRFDTDGSYAAFTASQTPGEEIMVTITEKTAEAAAQPRPNPLRIVSSITGKQAIVEPGENIWSKAYMLPFPVAVFHNCLIPLSIIRPTARARYLGADVDTMYVELPENTIAKIRVVYHW